jgi:hypothetical protein
MPTPDKDFNKWLRDQWVLPEEKRYGRQVFLISDIWQRYRKASNYF